MRKHRVTFLHNYLCDKRWTRAGATNIRTTTLAFLFLCTQYCESALDVSNQSYREDAIFQRWQWQQSTFDMAIVVTVVATHPSQWASPSLLLMVPCFVGFNVRSSSSFFSHDYDEDVEIGFPKPCRIVEICDGSVFSSLSTRGHSQHRSLLCQDDLLKLWLPLLLALVTRYWYNTSNATTNSITCNG